METLVILAATIYCISTQDEIISSESNDVNFTHSFFGKIKNIHIYADEADEDTYPWIAKVIHSRSHGYPVICTANCISSRVFITAARCIYGLVPRYTSLEYRKAKLSVISFLLPENPTKQMHNDVGFIVANEEWTGLFSTVNISKLPLDDEHFSWFSVLAPYTVVGYATLQTFFYAKRNINFNLTRLPVILDMRLCNRILTLNGVMQAFYVTCYHSCTYEQFLKYEKDCDRYHGVEGGAVLNKDDEIVGVATWGSSGRVPLPVGFAPLTGNAFWNDFECAKLLAEVKNPKESGSLQNACNTLKEKNVTL